MFFSFDGLDGVGKTTQISLFCQWLESQGRSVVACRDPGSTPLGDALRTILLERQSLNIDITAEMLLYMAARAQLVAEVIRPALAAGKTVVADRYLLANVVYQGHATPLGPEAVRAVGRIATGDLLPDRIFLLDMPVAAAQQRLSRPLDRIEQRGADYRERLRHGYRFEAESDRDRIAVIDAGREPDAVQQSIRAAAWPLLAPGAAP